MHDEGRLPILYILSSSRSGSTLLSLMLGSLPGVLALGEFARVWREGIERNHYCACGARFLDCPLWSGAIADALGPCDAARARAFFRAEGPLHRRSRVLRPHYRLFQGPIGAAFHEALAARIELYRALAKRAGASLLVDSTKRPTYALAFRRHRAVDFRVIHLVRDARAVVYSNRRPKPSPLPGDPDHLMSTAPPPRVALRWTRLHLLAELDVRPFLPTMRVYYEDLCRNPEREMRRILRFAGRPELARHFDPDAIRPENHMLQGNPIRYDRGPVRVRLDDAWRTEMPAKLQRTALARTWPLLALYGYLPPWRRRYDQ